MKKIMMILFLVSSLMVSVSAQNIEFETPNSVSILGDNYSKEFQQISNTLQSEAKVLLNNSNAFNSIGKLLNSQEKAWGVEKGNSTESIISNLDFLFKGGDLNSLPINNIDPMVFKFMNSILIGIESLNDETQLEPYLLSISQKLIASNFSAYDKQLVSSFITGLNASIKIIVNSPKFQTSGEQGRFSLWGAIKCAAGTVGGALLGGIAGAAVGTVTLPVVGTVCGATTGFYGGALSGMAAAC
jgi:hypothetical protein